MLLDLNFLLSIRLNRFQCDYSQQKPLLVSRVPTEEWEIVAKPQIQFHLNYFKTKTKSESREKRVTAARYQSRDPSLHFPLKIIRQLFKMKIAPGKLRSPFMLQQHRAAKIKQQQKTLENNYIKRFCEKDSLLCLHHPSPRQTSSTISSP